MQIGPGVLGVEGNRRLELAPGLRQPGLHLAKKSERKVRRRPVRNTPLIDGFQQ
jgi:hypothetical protein